VHPETIHGLLGPRKSCPSSPKWHLSADNRSTNTCSKCNLTYDRITATHESFNCIHQVVPMSTPIPHIQSALPLPNGTSIGSSLCLAHCCARPTQTDYGTWTVSSNRPHICNAHDAPKIMPMSMFTALKHSANN